MIEYILMNFCIALITSASICFGVYMLRFSLDDFEYLVTHYGNDYRKYANNPKLLENNWLACGICDEISYYYKINNIINEKMPKRPKRISEIFKWEESILYNTETYYVIDNKLKRLHGCEDISFAMIRVLMDGCITDKHEINLLNLKTLK
jgi:hypothetical protein